MVIVPAPIEALLGPRMTLEEWSDLPDDVPGELVDGRLVEEEVAGYAHEVLVSWLSHVLWSWAESVSAVVGGSDAKFAVGRTRGRKPDLTVFLGNRRPPARGVVTTPPDIAVEVVSSDPRDQARDRTDKMAEYAAFGIRFYWIVDPESRTLEIHELAPSGAYVLAVEAGAGSIESIPGCDGLVLDLDAMWAKADELTD